MTLSFLHRSLHQPVQLRCRNVILEVLGRWPYFSTSGIVSASAIVNISVSVTVIVQGVRLSLSSEPLSVEAS